MSRIMNRNLTNGKIGKSLLLFSLPMIFGNFLQQIYNIADTLIVGKAIGATALSAVGSSYALMVLLTSVILGLCMGSGAVFSMLFGAKRNDDMKTSIVNSFVFILLVSAVINIVAFLLLDKIIVWLNIPAEAVEYTKIYLKIIFIGLTFVSIYNFFAAVLRSVGNTVVPLIFLAVSAIVNIVLDLVLILIFNMGVAGAAWATVTAQMLSAICITVYFFAKGKRTLSLAPPHSLRPQAFENDYRKLASHINSAVDYEFWHFNSSGTCQQLWIFCERRIRSCRKNRLVCVYARSRFRQCILNIYRAKLRRR